LSKSVTSKRYRK